MGDLTTEADIFKREKVSRGSIRYFVVLVVVVVLLLLRLCLFGPSKSL